MCDTMVVLPNSSADGALLFAKNSDREPNEAHHLLAIPTAIKRRRIAANRKLEGG